MPTIDQQVREGSRFVQLTPPGSACSVVMGEGITDMPAGSQRGIQMVVSDVAAAREQLVSHGVAASEIDVQPWGSFVFFSDPDGNTWSLQQLPAWSAGGLTAAYRAGPAEVRPMEMPNASFRSIFTICGFTATVATATTLRRN